MCLYLPGPWEQVGDFSIYAWHSCWTSRRFSRTLTAALQPMRGAAMTVLLCVYDEEIVELVYAQRSQSTFPRLPGLLGRNRGIRSARHR